MSYRYEPNNTISDIYVSNTDSNLTSKAVLEAKELYPEISESTKTQLEDLKKFYKKIILIEATEPTNQYYSKLKLLLSSDEKLVYPKFHFGITGNKIFEGLPLGKAIMYNGAKQEAIVIKLFTEINTQLKTNRFNRFKTNLIEKFEQIGENITTVTEKKWYNPEITSEKKVYNDEPIFFNNIYYNYKYIEEQIYTIKYNISSSVLESLNDEEKLILDLPLLEWKLGFKWGAIVMLHWLQTSGDSLILPYDFFTSLARVKNIDTEYLTKIQKAKYASLYDKGYMFDAADSEEYLYNVSVSKIYEAYQKIKDELKSIEEFTPTHFGDFELPIASTTDNNIRNNFIQSHTIGNVTGDLDDIGVALGRYSFRIYFKGVAEKKNAFASMNIYELAYRFADSFDFKGSQKLGCWKHDLDNPDLGIGYAYVHPLYTCLNNTDFQNITKKTSIGNDFLIFSETKTLEITPYEIIFSV